MSNRLSDWLYLRVTVEDSDGFTITLIVERSIPEFSRIKRWSGSNEFTVKVEVM